MEQHEIAFGAPLPPESGSAEDLRARLREMINAWGQATVERDAVKVQLGVATEELDAVLKHEASLVNQLAFTRGERDNARNERDSARDQLAQSNRSRDVIAQQRDRFRGEVTTCKGHIRELRSDLHRMRTENEKFQAGLSDVLNERDTAREQLETLKCETHSTESALEAALDTARVFHEEKITAQQDAQRLLDENEQLKNQLGRMRHNRDSSDMAREGLQADLDAALKREKLLEYRVRLAQEDIQDLSAAKKKWEANCLNAKQDLPAQAAPKQDENSRVAVLAAFKDVVEAELSHWEGDTSKRLLDRALTLINNCTG